VNARSSTSREVSAMRSTIHPRSWRGLAAVAAATLAGAVLVGGPAGAQSPNTASGDMRFMVGPWSPNEEEVFNAIAANCKEQFPNVNFSVDLFDWGTSSAQVNASLAENAHDIYYLGEGIYPQRAATEDFLDLTERINDPAFADEKAKYVNWERTDALSPRHIGLPIAFHVEDALFVNMDKVRAAGFDETFVDSWDTFKDAVAAMTTDDTYGLGIGIQIGGFAEWYQRLRAAGGSYLTADLSAPNVNKPEVVQATQDMIDMFTNGYAPPLGTFTYDTAPDAFLAGRLATYSTDLATSAVIQGKPAADFEWKVLPYPPVSDPGPDGSRLNFNDMGYLSIASSTPNPDLAWEVLKCWTNSENDAYWADHAGTYPARVDAGDFGYGTAGAPQLAESLALFQQFSVGPEPFPEWGTIEDQAEAQIQDAYAGSLSAQDAVTNIENIVKEVRGL
jgi:ABC-type glycerol-3-phosphate transport system substrate-binding protein